MFLMAATILFMTPDELRTSVNEPEEPLLAALWWEAREEWSKAHEIAQDVDSADGAWVHAYLHRKEGDAWNAGYWYRQAGRPHCQLSHDEEWAEIARQLLLR
jgi:hypothetical protein